LTVAEKQELTRTYFKVLEPYALDDVVQAGRRCLETLKRFPTVSDWIDALGGPRVDGSAPPDIRQLTMSECAERADAERRRYAADPCGCVECIAAGVADRPMRYVPTLVNGTEDRAWHPQLQRVDVVGHWCHADELRRWYDARAACFAAV